MTCSPGQIRAERAGQHTLNLPFAGEVLSAQASDRAEQSWYALLVRSRHEFAAARELDRKGLETYAPALARLRQWKDRRKLVQFPLFPGYIFVRLGISALTYLSVMETRGVVRFVSLVPGTPTPLNPHDIDSLKRMLNAEVELGVYGAIQHGTVVRVRRGPLCGSVGIFARREGEDVFLINFDLLGRSVGVKIYADDLEQA